MNKFSGVWITALVFAATLGVYFLVGDLGLGDWGPLVYVVPIILGYLYWLIKISK